MEYPNVPSWTIPYISLRRQHALLAGKLQEAVNLVIASDEVQAAGVVEDFEQRLARYLEVPHVVAVASGTDALHIALSILDLPPGSEVITSAFGFFSTAASIIHAGLVPVFVDAKADTFNIDPARIEDAISNHSVAILPAHLYGRSLDIEPVREVARKYSLAVIEDAAQAIGCRVGDTMAGTIGTIGCFSFNWSKNLGTMGNGGALVMEDSDLAHKAKVIRNYGNSGSFHHTYLGLNSKLDPIEAAILATKLPCLDDWNARRLAIAARYNMLLHKMPNVRVPDLGGSCNHTFHKYALLAEYRDELQTYLKNRGIETMVFYPTPLHRQPCFAHHARTPDPVMEVSERIARSVLCLPIYPELTDEEVDYVANSVAEFYA